MCPEILYIPRDVLFRNQNFQGYVAAEQFRLPHPDTEQMQTWWAPKDKETTEQNPFLKQIIPYIFLYDPSAEQFFAYTRHTSGGEGRLHDKSSLGVGGHIEKKDCHKYFWATVIYAARRELLEEVGIYIPHEEFHRLELKGYINYDFDVVGQVHFGIVFRLEVTPDEREKLVPCNQEMVNPRWLRHWELTQMENPETWSAFLGSGLCFCENKL